MLNLSVVVPALNARRSLAATLAPLRSKVREIVVSDGGSADGTPDEARRLGAVVIVGAPGRGGQLRRGAAAASADWLLFLHADTRLEPGWEEAVSAVMAEGEAKAGYFRFALDDPAPQARRLETMVAWRARTLGLPYGDQGLLIARKFYDGIGGFRDMPLMEDVDLVRRIGRSRLKAMPVRAVTSADKFRRDGYWRRSAKNLFCLGLFYVWVSPAAIKRIYG